MSDTEPLSQNDGSPTVPSPSLTVPEPQPDPYLFVCRNCGNGFPEAHSSCPRCTWDEPPQKRVRHSVPNIDYKAHDIYIRSSTAQDICQHEVSHAEANGNAPSFHNELWDTCNVGDLSFQVYEAAPECIKYTVPSSFVSRFIWLDELTGTPTCDHVTANDSIIKFLQQQQQATPPPSNGSFPCQIAVAFTRSFLRTRDDGAVVLTKHCKCQCPGCPIATRFAVHLSVWRDQVCSSNGQAEFSVMFRDDLRVCKHLVGATFGQTRGPAREVLMLLAHFIVFRYLFWSRFVCLPLCLCVLAIILACPSLLSRYFFVTTPQRMSGPKPHLISQKALSADNISDERLLTGNLQNVPRQVSAQHISSQNNTKHRRDPDLLKSLQLIALESEISDKDTDTSTSRKLYGSVHDIRLSPPSLIVTSEGMPFSLCMQSVFAHMFFVVRMSDTACVFLSAHVRYLCLAHSRTQLSSASAIMKSWRLRSLVCMSTGLSVLTLTFQTSSFLTLLPLSSN